MASGRSSGVAVVHSPTKIGWPAYLGGMVRALRRSPRTDFTISSDSATPLRHSGVGVLVGNVGRLQAGLAVLPDAPDDGLADLILLAPRPWSDWPRIAWQMRTGNDTNRYRHTIVTRAAKLTISASVRHG